MKNALFIFLTLVTPNFGCGPAVNTSTPPAVSPVLAALRELPERNPMRQSLQKIADKVQAAKELCAQKIGKSGGDRNQLYHILTNCANSELQFLSEVKELFDPSAETQYKKAFTAIEKEIKTTFRFYTGARQCVLESETQREFDTCIAMLTQRQVAVMIQAEPVPEGTVARMNRVIEVAAKVRAECEGRLKTAQEKKDRVAVLKTLATCINNYGQIRLQIAMIAAENREPQFKKPLLDEIGALTNLINLFKNIGGCYLTDATAEQFSRCLRHAIKTFELEKSQSR